MYKSIKYVLTLISVAIITGAFSIDSVKAQPGATAVPFLQIEPDSRMAGMGNAGTSFADNSHAVFWNPAGLAFQQGNEVSITHADWLPNFDTDLFYDYLVGRYYVDGIGAIGGHITYLNLGEQTHTDGEGRELGTFRSYEVATGLSYGYNLTDNIALGTGLRFIYSALSPVDVEGQESSNGVSVGVDLATMYKSNYFDVAGRNAKVGFGVNVQNIGPDIQYVDEEQKDPLPTTLRFGWTYKMDLDREGYNTLRLSNDYSRITARRDLGTVESLYRSWNSVENMDDEIISLAEQFMISAGMEYWYDDLFAVRTGYFYEDPKNGNREFMTFGAGLRYSMVGVDFSYIYTIEEDHPLADTIRLTALLTF